VPGPDAVHLSSNDYLCLAWQAELVNAQIGALQQETHDLLMSAIFLHGDNPQGRLEAKFARFIGCEDVILSQSGWSANVGLIQSLAGPENPVYLDMVAHASLWEGARAAEARPVPFLHNDASHLERQIAKHGPGIIAVDSVYSTTGSVCPVRDILEVAERTGSVLVVDESHSLGTHGPHGAGLVAALGLQDRVHFITASLAKAFAGRAGLITCSSRFKGYFAMEARPAVFSSCLLRHDIAWFDAALDFIGQVDDRRARLRQVTRTVRDGLEALGYNVSQGTEQIIALEAGPEQQTLALRNALQENGIFGAVFCAPATAKNRSLMRLTLNSGLTDIEIARLLEVCGKIRDRVGLQDWPSTRRKARSAAA
jgi:CAI-1 autoinducer synthase